MVVVGVVNPIDSTEDNNLWALEELITNPSKYKESKDVISMIDKEFPEADPMLVLSLARDFKAGSGEQEMIEGYRGKMSDRGIKRIFKGLNPDGTYKSSETQSNEMSATQKVGAGAAATAAGAYGLRKGISAIRKEIPNAVKRGDIYNDLYRLMLGNYNEKPAIIKKRVDNMIKLVQNMSDQEIKQIGKKGYGALFDYVNGGLKQIQDVRQVMLDSIKLVKIDGAKLLKPLDEQIAAALDIGDEAKATELQKVYDETKRVIEKDGGSITVEKAEKMKENFYDKYNKYDKAEKMGMTQGDLSKGEGYKTQGKVFKEAIEETYDTVNPETKGNLKLINKEYGAGKDIQYSVGGELNKIQSQPVYSKARAIGSKFKPIIAKTPFVPSQALPSLSKGAEKTSKLGDTLRYIKKRGKRMLASAEKEAPEIIQKESPKIVQKTIGKTISKVAPKVLGVAGIAGVAQQLAPDPLAGQESEGNIPAKMVPIAQNLIGKYKGKKEIPEREIVRAGFMGNEIQAVKNEFKKRQTGVKPVELKKGTAGIKETLKKTAKTSLGL